MLSVTLLRPSVMHNKLPSLIHLFSEDPTFLPSSSITESLSIIPAPIGRDIILSDMMIGIILDVEYVTAEHYALLKNYSTLFNVGLCIIAKECPMDILQRLSLLFHTVQFPPIQLSDEYEQTCESVLGFFLSIAKTKDYNNVLKTQTYQTSTLEALGTVAHQWRQPINLISVEAMNLMILANLEEAVKSSEVLKSADAISEQAHRMANVLKSILKMGHERKAKTLFSINALLDTVKFFFNGQLRNQEIELVTVALTDDREIYGFPTDLEEVLINLIANARDAYQNCTSSPQKTITLAITFTDECCIISVRDNAGGVDESLKERIFKPNFSTKAKGEGFGIGLHIGRLIIEQEFKGSLNLKSHPNGAEFIITIPRHDLCTLKFIH